MANGYQSGTQNTIGMRSGMVGGNFPVWTRIREIYQGGGTIDVSASTGFKAGDVIGAGTMVKFNGPGKKVDVFTATEYSASAKYKVNDYVIQANKLYKNKTAISTPEAFDSSKWTETSLDTLGVNGLIMDDVCIPSNCEVATCAVVHSGRIYADRVMRGIPKSFDSELLRIGIECVRES